MPHSKASLLVFAATALFLFLGALNAVRATEALKTVAEMRSLSYWELRTPHPINVQGVVTLVDHRTKRLVIQDGTGAVEIYTNTIPATLSAGTIVNVSAEDGLPYFPKFPEYPANPTFKDLLPMFETQPNWAEQYIDRVRGYLIAPASGSYRFWISSDDSSELWLSDNERAEGIRRIARVEGWTKQRDWTYSAVQHSDPIMLEAGKRYYIEALHEQLGGEGHLSVAWEGPGIPRQVIDGAYLSPWSDNATAAGTELYKAPSGAIFHEAWKGALVDGIWRLTIGRWFESVLSAPESLITPTGTSPFPEARRMSGEQSMSPEDYFRWSSVEGTVDFVSVERGALKLELLDGSKRIRAIIEDWNGDKPQRLKHRRIQLEGVAEAGLNYANEWVLNTLRVPSVTCVHIVDTEPFSKPFHAASIWEILEESDRQDDTQQSRIFGEIVARPGPHELTLRDAGTFSAFTSRDGVTWEQVGGTVDVPMGKSIFAGIAVNSNSDELHSTAVFDHVKGLSPGAHTVNIGGSAGGGATKREGDNYIVKGSGHQIWILDDQFYFDYQPLQDEGEIVVRLASVSAPHDDAKAGIMMRESLDPDAQFVDLMTSRSMGVSVQWRQMAEGAAPKYLKHDSAQAPCWLKLVRRYSTLPVIVEDSGSFQVGQTVEAIGYPTRVEGRTVLTDAYCRNLSREPASKTAQTGLRPTIEISRLNQGPGAMGRVDYFKVRGVVTFSGMVSGKPYFAVQDASGGTFVTPSLLLVQTLPEAGELVEIHSDPGWRATPTSEFVADRIVKLGPGVAPHPLKHPLEYLLPRRGEGTLVECEGIVRSVSDDGSLLIKDKGELFWVVVQHAEKEKLSAWIDCKVRLRGVLSFPSERDRLLLVSSTKEVEVLDLRSKDPFALSPQPIRSLKPEQLINQSFHRLKIAGVVTAADRDLIYIQDSDTGIKVDVRTGDTPAPGDMVEAVGFPDLAADNSLILSNALLRPKPLDKVPEALATTVETLSSGQHGSRLVRFKAVVARHQENDTEHAIEFESPNRTVFAALSRTGDHFPKIPAGSVVEVTGVCTTNRSLSNWTQGGTSHAFEPVVVLLNAATDLSVLQKPRWWVVQRTLLASSVVIVIGLLAALWIHQLRRRVAQRTAELAATMEKLQRETQVAATLSERNRLAGEIHDSLEQGFSGLLLQLETTAKHHDCPPEVRAGLDLARNMVTFSRAEVQHAVWDLQSPLLEHSDLVSALEKMIEQLNPETPRITLSATGAVCRLPSPTEHHLLRIAQEAITNSIKHSGATHIKVSVDFTETLIGLSIRDDGHGFEPSRVLTGGVGHFGLRSLRGRAKKLGGEIHITSEPGAGTTVSISVPRIIL